MLYPFKDDLLIPLYSQLQDLLFKGEEIELNENKIMLRAFLLQMCNDLAINPFLLGIECHSSHNGCKNCTVKGMSSKFNNNKNSNT